MNLILIIFALSLLMWFLGVAAAAYHVLKYASPDDKLVSSFLVFLGLAGTSFFAVISFVMGAL